MKPLPLIKPVLSAMLLVSISAPALAHPGHGNEFQAVGDVQKVQVNPQTDQQIGIVVTPIAQAASGGAGVMIPMTALVDADGKQIAFVQYENFYEPVEVTTGATQGDLVEVTQGLSMGEELVTQGSLMLYAQSRKTQPAEPTTTAQATTAPDATVASPAAIATPKSEAEHTQAHAQGLAHSHDEPSGGWSIKKIAAAIGGGAVLLVGAVVFIGTRKKKTDLSDKQGGI